MPGDGLDPKSIVVVIPTLNEEKHIATVLTAIIRDDPIAATCPVIVADGGSTDLTTSLVAQLAEEFPNVAMIDNPGRTQAAALNRALAPEFADYDILIRCDAHSAYPTGYVSRLAQKLIAVEAASVVVPMDALANEGCFQKGLAWVADSPLGAGGSPHRGGTKSGWVDHGHHAAFRMSVFRELGGYDTTFRTNEDAEYDRRVLAAGHRIWLDAKNRIGYYPRETPGALWKQYFRYGAGRARTCQKHRIAPQPRQLIPVLHAVVLLGSLPLLAFGPIGLVYPALYSSIAVAAGAWTGIRHHSACGLYAGLALAIMHTAWGMGFLVQCIRASTRIKATAHK